MDAINSGDNEKIVKLSNLMLQGALISANYTDALGLLHNILSRMPQPKLIVDGTINTKGMNAILECSKKMNALAATKLYTDLYNTYGLASARSQFKAE